MVDRFFIFVGCLAGCTALTSGSDDGKSPLIVDSGGLQGTAQTATPSGMHTFPVGLVDARDWTVVSAEDDFFLDHRPGEVICDGLGLHPEDGAFEVETTYCNYASVEQSLQVDLPSGARLDLLFSHGPLTWTEPTEAHAAVTVDGQLVWERFVPIPSEGWVYPDEGVLLEAASKGSIITFHCHNHGANSYRLYAVNWVGS